MSALIAVLLIAVYVLVGVIAHLMHALNKKEPVGFVRVFTTPIGWFADLLKRI